VNETVTEITSTQVETVATPPAKPKSTRGGYRPGGGRPRKIRPEKAPMTGSSLPALPPTQGGVTRPQKFFDFWTGLTETQLAQTIVYINRHYPVCDAKVKDPEAPKYIDKLVGPCPCVPTEWREWFLKTYGSGDYRIYFNEGSAQRLRVEVEGLRDYENYPPKIDWDTLMVSDPRNRDFIRWARTHGYAEEIRRLESGVTPEALKGKEDEEMNAAIIEQNTNLTGQLVEMAREVAAKPAVGPRETLAERSALGMVEEAGKTANRMTEKAFDMLASRTNENADPLAQTRTVIEIAKTMSESRSGDNLLIEMMRDQIQAQRDEMRELRVQLNTQAATPAQAPRTLTEQLQELVLTRSLMREAMGDDGSDDKETPIKPGSPKAIFMDVLAKSAPALVQAAPGILQSIFYGVNLLLRKPGDTSAPPPPPPAPAPPAINPQQKQEEDRVAFFLRMIEGAIKKHLNEWEERDYPGADFADWLINSQLDGRNSYDQLKAAGPELIVAQLSQYPPIASVMVDQNGAVTQKFAIFVQQFIERDDIRQRQRDEEDEDEEDEATPVVQTSRMAKL
jgi:hypothetical protein